MVTVLVSLSHARALRTIGPTLDELLDRGHRVVVDLELPDRHAADGGLGRAMAWAASRPAAEVRPFGPRRWGRGRVAAGLRAAVDHDRHQPPRGDDPGGPTSIARRSASWVPRWYGAVHRRLGPTGRQRTTRALAGLERAVAPRRDAQRLLGASRPDAVLVSPLVLPGTRQVELVRAAGEAGIPTCLVVESWDNLTTKGALHCRPDRVVVWNEAQADEAVARHGVDRSRIVLSGASPFDVWTGFRAPPEAAGAQLRAVGLDPERPYLLYLGSSPAIVADEGALLAAWLELVMAGDHPVQVLVRPHPRNPIPGDVVPLGARDDVRVVSSAEAALDTGPEEWRSYGASLQHCAAAVGVNSTALLEAALLGRPVLAVPAPLWDPTVEPPHHHHLRSSGGGLLQGGTDVHEHAAALRAALSAPPGAADQRSAAFTAAFLRPLGPDVRGSAVVADVVESLAGALPRRTCRVGD